MLPSLKDEVPAHLSLTYPEFLNTHTSPEISEAGAFPCFLVNVVSRPELAINFNKRLKFSWVLFKNAKKGRFRNTYNINITTINVSTTRASSLY